VPLAKPLTPGLANAPEAARLPTLLTSKDVARLLQVAPSTLCRWRQTGKGPRVYWLGSGSPRYREDDVLEWLERMAA
jgi:predicted DNA-binding transcriptional regulator AlpA